MNLNENDELRMINPVREMKEKVVIFAIVLFYKCIPSLSVIFFTVPLTSTTHRLFV